MRRAEGKRFAHSANAHISKSRYRAPTFSVSLGFEERPDDLHQVMRSEGCRCGYESAVHLATMRVMSSCCSVGLKLWICSTTDVRVWLADIALLCRKTSTSLCSPNSSPEA